MPYKNYLQSISSSRSHIYKIVFRTQTDEETCGAVLWGQAMASSLQSLVTTFEVALRNRIHVSLSRQYSVAKGLPATDSYAWYDELQSSLPLSGKTKEKVEKILCGVSGGRLATQPHPDRVVSSISFGVWPNILDAQLPTQTIEELTFKDVFPYHPKVRQHWRHSSSRKDAVAVVKDVQNWRNRLAHCKPVWSEGWFRSQANPNWKFLLMRLNSRKQSILEVLEWICPDTAEIYQKSYASQMFGSLNSEAAVMAYVFQPTNTCSLPIYPTFSPADIVAYKAR